MTPEQEQLIQQFKNIEATLTPEQKLKFLKEINTLISEVNDDVRGVLDSIK